MLTAPRLHRFAMAPPASQAGTCATKLAGTGEKHVYPEHNVPAAGCPPGTLGLLQPAWLQQGQSAALAGGAGCLQGHLSLPKDCLWEFVARGNDDSITEEPENFSPNDSNNFNNNKNSRDELYDEAVALVVREGRASTSFIQRHLKIGYNRAATIIEKMEDNNVISKPGRAGKRDILIEDT